MLLLNRLYELNPSNENILDLTILKNIFGGTNRSFHSKYFYNRRWKGFLKKKKNTLIIRERERDKTELDETVV